MVRASRAGNNLRTAAGDHNVLGAVDGLLLDGGRGDGGCWRSSAGRGLNLTVDNLADSLLRSHDGASAEGSEDERVLHFD